MDKINVNSQLEHLQSKYVGTGHADVNKYEWLVNQHRDSYASYLGQPGLVTYMSIAEGVSSAKMRANFLERMLQPCGPPPPKLDPDAMELDD